jgi:hypothetical protein
MTPRRVAWVLVLLGGAWFVQVSPRTPLEFFDAAVRDNAAIQRYTLAQYERLDPAAAAKARQYEELLACKQQMDRLGLLHELTHDPRRVQKQRDAVLGGHYDASERTDAVLKANDTAYRALAQRFDERRAANKLKTARFNDLVDRANRDYHFQATVFRMMIDRISLRRFQGKIFWREKR